MLAARDMYVSEDIIGSGFSNGYNSCGAINNECRLELHNCEMEKEFNEGKSYAGGDCFGDISESEGEGEKSDIGFEGKDSTSIDKHMIQSDVECAAIQTSNPVNDGNDNSGKAESADETGSEDEEEIIVDAELNQEFYFNKEQEEYRTEKDNENYI